MGSPAFVLEDVGVSAYATAMTISNEAGTEIVSYVFDEPILWSVPQIYTSTLTGSAEILRTLLTGLKFKRDVINGVPAQVSASFVGVNSLLSSIVIDITE